MTGLSASRVLQPSGDCRRQRSTGDNLGGTGRRRDHAVNADARRKLVMPERAIDLRDGCSQTSGRSYIDSRLLTAYCSKSLSAS